MNTITKIIIGSLTSIIPFIASADTLVVEGDLDVQGTLKVGDTTNTDTNPSEGSVRFGDNGDGTDDLLGYVDGTWKSLTTDGGSGSNQTLTVNGNQLVISGGNTVTLPSGNPSDELISDFSYSGSQLTITDAGGVRSVTIDSSNPSELSTPATQAAVVSVVDDNGTVEIQPVGDATPALAIAPGGLVTVANAQGDIPMGVFTAQ